MPPFDRSGTQWCVLFSMQFWRDLRAYYRGCQGRDLHEFYDLESRFPYFDHVSRILGTHKRRLLLRWISQQPPDTPILELGGGIGTFACQLGHRGYRVVAVDISGAKTLKAQRLTAKRYNGARPLVHHVVGDLRQLGTDSALDHDIQRLYDWPALQRFEVLLAADVLEHMPEPPCHTLRHLRHLLMPQGRFFTSVPSWLCRHDPGHFWALFPEEWEQAFCASGFHIARRGR